jgi:MFS family permease
MPDWTGPGPTVDYLDMTVMWDGSWYRQAALHGYPVPLPVNPLSGHVGQSTWAFYPLFPLLSRMLMSLTGLGFPVVGSTLALVCGLGAAVLMGHLLSDRVGPRVALAAVAVWAAFPSAVSLQLAYTESIAMLVLCGFLWAVMRRAWLLSAGLVLLLGLTRPIAVPAAVVVAVALWVRWRDRRERPLTGGEAVSGAVALAAAGLASILWPLVAWAATGSRSAYTDTMSAWRAGGHIVPLKPWLWMSEWFFRDSAHPGTYGPVGLAALVTTLVVMTCGPWATRLGPELRTWCLAYPAYLALVLDPFTSIFRYALPLFPLVVVALGGGWVGRTAQWLWTRSALFVVLGVVGQVFWIWKLLIYWPPSDYPP